MTGHHDVRTLLEPLSSEQLARLDITLAIAVANGADKIDLARLVHEIQLAPPPQNNADPAEYEALLREHPFPVHVVCVTGLSGSVGTRCIYGAKSREEAQAIADAQHTWRSSRDASGAFSRSGPVRRPGSRFVRKRRISTKGIRDDAGL
jgi:hypothetical protein